MLALLALAALASAGVATAVWAAERSPTSGAVGSELYLPCPERSSPCRVLPLGDSLTWGIGYDGGYRVQLFERARAAGKRITFTGSQQNGPALVEGTHFPRNHEGRSGWTIDQIATTIPLPALATVPHIVLLHAGTNDVYAHSSATAMADSLERLLDRLEHAAPDALVVVTEILPLADPALKAAAEAYNQELARRIQRRCARGEHVILAHLSTNFPTALLSDGVHPTHAGYDRMADSWYSAIAPHLP